MKTAPLLGYLYLLLSVTSLNAQGWKELNPPRAIFNAFVKTLAADAAGNIYAAGNFKNDSNEFVVVKWNGHYWSEVGQGANALKANNGIISIAVDANGNLYAAGAFTNNLGRTYVAKWNGVTWTAVGSSFSGLIYSLIVDNSGNVYAGGSITNSSGKKYISKWNGTTWEELGSGTNGLNTDHLVYSLATDNNGKVYAAGMLTNSNNRQYVAVWNGTNWSELGTGQNSLNANGYISSIATDINGNVYAAGDFRNASGNTYVARWNSTSWSEMGSINTNDVIANLLVKGNIVYATGRFTNQAGNYYVSKWDGNSWSTAFIVPNHQSGSTIINALTADNTGKIYAGGNFTNSSGDFDVIRWDGSSVVDLGRHGSNLKAVNGIYQLKHDNNGNVYAVIDDTYMGKALYKWDGVGWKLMGDGSESVESVAIDPAGNVYGGGRFQNANNCRIAKWNGSAWVEVDNPLQPLNAHTSSGISYMMSDNNGNIYAAGKFGTNGVTIAKWDGTGWSYFNNNFIWQVDKMVIDGNGNIYSIGFYYTAGRWYVMKITPTDYGEVRSATSFLNATTSLIYDINVDASGNLYATGGFTNSSNLAYMAKWDGSTWSEVSGLATYGPGPLTALAVSGNNVFITGRFNQSTTNFVAKWNGSAWSKLLPEFFGTEVSIMSADPLETVYAAGSYFPSNGYRSVMAHGYSVKKLEQPNTTSLGLEYCKSANPVIVKLHNRPDGNRVKYDVKLDSNPLNVSTDSTVTLNFSTMTPGNHSLQISYSIGTDTMLLVHSFNVTDAVTPDVNLAASTTVVTNLNPLTITATNSSGGGTNPLYTFAKDRSFSNLIQAESTANAVIINPNTLGNGLNRIYVRMKTNAACFVSQYGIDSIDITVTIVTGVIDPANPQKQITISPVPVDNQLRISGLSTAKTYTLTINDLYGRELYRRKIHNQSEFIIIDPVSLPGVYWLRIYDNLNNRHLGSLPFMK